MSRLSTHDILAPPEPGYFLIRLVRKGWAHVPARITHENGLWQAEINGLREGPAVSDPLQSRSIMRIWETGRKVEKVPDYDHAMAVKLWAETHEPSHPAANPRQPIDLTTLNPLWRTE